MARKPMIKPLFPGFKAGQTPKSVTATKKDPRETFRESVLLQQQVFEDPEAGGENRKRAIHKWWKQGRDGAWYITMKYGPHTIPYTPEAPAIRVEREADIPAVFTKIIEVLDKGVLDDTLQALSQQTGRRLHAARAAP